MDLRLVALLLFCHCRHGWTSLGDSEFLSATTSPPSLTMESEKASSEEEPDGICASSLKSKKATGHGILKLGLELMEKLKTGPEQPNIIISPLSISLALSQLALGAENQTKDLLLHHLHAEVPVCYHKAFRSLLLQLQQSTPQIATRMYTAPGFEPKLEFVQDSQQMYNSKPEVFPGVEEVNEWVKKATNGHVTDLLTNVPPELVLMLINAVHYKGEWQTSFDPRHTASDLFYVDNKHIVNVEMMVEPKYPLRLFIHNELDAQVARLPFKDQMSLLIVLPMAGQVNVSDIAEKFNMSDVYSQLQRERSMQVRLPKFKMEYSQELQEVLTSIGLGELFTAPNLSGISDSPLQVTSVQHKTSMEINEKGAEAAAATSVSVSRSNPIFSVNQPFFFALMDDETLAPIFLGVINNPNPDGATRSKGSGKSDKLGLPRALDKPHVRTFEHPPK
ncbi:serpin peptidase inhibitor, clade F (alpha-2 antiplasmin, pigment epithelium derived factor), member 2b [Denticeps clupeoides]|uniref:serpin peptidase inhibitor, clade F (alpha-2 antiplasmin, pigment epithelium derived factor), member 2b n=1 Tax=Denticeps clupeoides TaxID=299321 RepID=UPI0010A4C606|nr:alpha-2-antiplasmin [Denticeps clupeoides]